MRFAALMVVLAGCGRTVPGADFVSPCGINFYAPLYSEEDWGAYEAKMVKAMDDLGLWENTCGLVVGLRVHSYAVTHVDGRKARADTDCDYGIIRLNEDPPSSGLLMHELAHFLHPAGCYSPPSYDHAGLYWQMIKWQQEEAKK